MIGWFANAMMAAHDAAVRASRAAATTPEALRAHLLDRHRHLAGLKVRGHLTTEGQSALHEIREALDVMEAAERRAGSAAREDGAPPGAVEIARVQRVPMPWACTVCGGDPDDRHDGPGHSIHSTSAPDDGACASCGHSEDKHDSPIANGCCQGEWERCGCFRFRAPAPATASPPSPVPAPEEDSR